MDFTIVIPVHNGMPYIKDCIDSALNQDYDKYNIIILENMSDDGTVEYLDSLDSARITVFKSDRLLSIEENWARIKDLDMNEYMTILMADDKLENNYLSSICEMIKKHPNCNIYRTNLNLINEKSEVFYSSNINEIVTIYDYLEGRLSHTYTETAAGYCFKTSRYKEIGGIDCKFRLMHTDDKLFMEAIGENNYMAVSPNHSTNYRCHTGSESGSPNAEAQIGGFNLWMNWIYNLNDKKLRQIVVDYLPFHLTQIVLFFSPEVMAELKKIYRLYKIDENDLHHKWIDYKRVNKSAFQELENRKFIDRIKEKIKFTFVLPVHNGMPKGRNYIQAQIESILNQDYKNFNLIILENCSDDGTTGYLKSLKHEKIEVQYSDRLLSIDENWKRIINVKRNEYMIMAMADDLYKPNYLTELVKLISKYPEACVYRTNIEVINEDSEVVGRSDITETINFEQYLKGRLKHTYFETFQGYCFRTDFYNEVGGCPCIYKGFYMDDKLVLMALERHFMPVSSSYACCYRTHTSSCSGTPDFECDINGYNHLFNWIKNQNNKILNKIVRKYLPYHIKQFSKFFTNEQVKQYKEIYPLFNINENDLYHKFINFFDKYFYIRKGNKRIIAKILFIKIIRKEK